MLNFTWHEWVADCIGLAGIFGTLYFGLKPNKRRKLVYSINPVRTKVVTSGKASNLKVLYHDETFDNVDITAVQLAIWNAGDEGIESGDVLGDNPVTITTKPEARVLEAIIRNQPRKDVVKFEIPESKDSWTLGKVPINWKILEQNDAVSLQLIYKGEPDVNIKVEGNIRGRIPIKPVPASSRSLKEHKKSLRENIIGVSISLIVFVLTLILLFVTKTHNDILGEIVSFLFVASLFIGSILFLLLVQTLREKLPPIEY